MPMSRRRFLAGSTVVGLGARAVPFQWISGEVGREGPLVVSTHPFGRHGNEKAQEVLQAGGTALDAVEQGIRVVESIGNGSVGLSGGPNAAGYVQLDACIMNGPGHQAGAVAGIEGIVHPITAARRVMERSKHVLLVGEGARWFALEHGLESVDVSSHPEMKERWKAEHLGEKVVGEEDDGEHEFPSGGHDTIALLARHADGSIAGGCSTSGAGNKLPGRVGDSPILGSGLYVDAEVGAAGGTGLGENALRHCATFQIVELMRLGMAPAEACAEALHRMAGRDPLGYGLSLSFCALDRQGRWGGATTGGFSCSVTANGVTEVHETARVEAR